MELINTLLHLFTKKDFTVVKFNEQFLELNIEVSVSELAIPSSADLEETLKGFPSRDKIRIEISNQYDTESYTYGSQNKSIDEFLESVEEEIYSFIKDDDNEEITINLTIIKRISQKKISIYKFDKLVDHLTNLPLENILSVFANDLDSSNEQIIFEVQDLETEFETSKYYFIKPNKIYFNDLSNDYSSRKENLIKQRDQNCHFANSTSFTFIPDDFKLNRESNNTKFNDLMNKLSILFSLIYLANISSIEKDNSVSVKLNGYKIIDKIIKFEDFNLNDDTYFHVFNWVYQEGNISDKLGLARNIISLESKPAGNLLNISKNILESMHSNYQIYLKDNVEKYIEVKNKATEYLIQLSNEISDLIKSFSGALKNNLFVFSTFFTSTFIINSINAGQTKNIFNKDITYLTYAFIAMSSIYLILNIWDIRGNTEKIKSKLDDIKESYDNILDSHDLHRIFNKSKLDKDIEFLNNQIKYYSIAWCVILVIILITAYNLKTF